MINWFAVETETEFRRQEWEREVLAQLRLVEAGGFPQMKRVGFQPQTVWTQFRSLLTPRPRLVPAPEPCPSAPC
jgi:hypothetical protein